MCGIVGIFTRHSDASLEDVVEGMARAVRHRGPDAQGFWQDARGSIALGHQRLSILELSEAGAQPMQSPSGRYRIAFNGEIYNHLELRFELERDNAAPVWRGHSDTETLLACVDRWGLRRTLQACVGMFAIALWDESETTLTLARDRFGEKPLYYGWPSEVGGTFLFGSELKSLQVHPAFKNTLSRQALRKYLHFMYVPTPWSIYDGIFKLPPGCLLQIQGPPPERAPALPVVQGALHGSLSLETWWSLPDAMSRAAQSQLPDTPGTLELLESRLKDAVRLQSLADVPVGAFLSGGIDSSTVVALLQEQTSRPVKTFTVGFESPGYDESHHGRAVAQHLGTEHHELVVTSQEALDVVPLLPTIYDEPFADSSQIPTYLVCRYARQHVSVALSGDGGDELFGGYNRYLWAPRLWEGFRHIPYALRRGLSLGLQTATPETWNRWLERLPVTRPGEKLHKLASALEGALTIDRFYLNLATEWQATSALVVDDDASFLDVTSSSLPAPPPGVADAQCRMMFWDALTYLPDDILCKVDRAAMATSLETRVPFLDHRVAEIAWRLPMSMKIFGGEGKRALRELVYRRVRRELLDRPKTGFSIPLAEWLRGPLRPWAEDLLSESRLRNDGYLNPVPVRRAWAEHLSGNRDHTGRLWTILMLQSWIDAAQPRRMARTPRGAGSGTYF